MDIDHFKRYNDEFGHSAGDQVLKSIAEVLSQAMSGVDLVARYGGEEFAILLPNKTKAEAMLLAESVRQTIEKNSIYLRRVETRVTASLGVASYPDSGLTREEMIRAADELLYQAKRAGRNQVCGNS